MSRARVTSTDLAKLFNDCPRPVYVLDEERRIVYCNAACARWTGCKAGELLGQVCVYDSAAEGGPRAVAAGLCPPPQVFSGREQAAAVHCNTADGRLIQRRGHFYPLGDGQDDSAAVIAILQPDDAVNTSLDSSDADSDEKLHEQVLRFRQQMAGRFRPGNLIGASSAMTRARAQIKLAAATSANVLIVGPPGTGKEMVAKMIHYGASVVGPLVPLACATLETNLLRSTLRALAASHAHSRGVAGTLLLGDVDCMPLEAQLDLTELVRSGSLPMRLVATAAQRLDHVIDRPAFSQELACALSTINIELPPLVERLEDLPLLTQAFLEDANALGGKQVSRFTSEALDHLAAYGWPGNVDELAAMVRESHERASGGEVGVRDLPGQIHLAADAALYPARLDEPIVLEEFLARVERELIARALDRAKGNKSKAAKLLGLTRARLYRRLVQLELVSPEEDGDG